MYKPYIILERCFYVKKENFNNNYWGCNLCGFIIRCFDNGEGKKEKSINLGKSTKKQMNRAIGIRIFTELPNQRMVIIISHMILMELL